MANGYQTSNMSQNVSVIIPNYNWGKSVAANVPELVRCRFPIAEVFVIDDASTDDSRKWLTALSPPGLFPFSVHVILNAENAGASACRNMGIRQATGDLLLFLDADLVCDPEALDVLYQGVGAFDIAFPTITRTTGDVISPINDYSRKYGLNSAVFFARRAALGRMDSLFDEWMRVYHEDVDFFLRAHAEGLSSIYVSHAKLLHPEHPKGFTAYRYYYVLRNAIYLGFKLHGLVPYRIPYVQFALVFVGWCFLMIISGGQPLTVQTVFHRRGGASCRKVLGMFIRAIREGFSQRYQLREYRAMLAAHLQRRDHPADSGSPCYSHQHNTQAAGTPLMGTGQQE